MTNWQAPNMHEGQHNSTWQVTLMATTPPRHHESRANAVDVVQQVSMQQATHHRVCRSTCKCVMNSKVTSAPDLARQVALNCTVPQDKDACMQSIAGDQAHTQTSALLWLHTTHPGIPNTQP
jgi:hypothetical protein